MVAIMKALPGKLLSGVPVFAALTVVFSSSALAAGEVKLPQLDLTTYASQIFWLIISFIVLYFLVSRVAVPRISDVLEERQGRIANDLDKAERLKKEAEQVHAEYEKSLRDARERAHSILRAAQEELTAKAAEAEERNRDQIAGMLRGAEERIRAAQADAVGNIRSVASAVASDAVSRLSGMRVPEERIGRAVDNVMAERSQ